MVYSSWRAAAGWMEPLKTLGSVLYGWFGVVDVGVLPADLRKSRSSSIYIYIVDIPSWVWNWLARMACLVR